jgi:hypothetical protein
MAAVFLLRAHQPRAPLGKSLPTMKKKEMALNLNLPVTVVVMMMNLLAKRYLQSFKERSGAGAASHGARFRYALIMSRNTCIFPPECM